MADKKYRVKIVKVGIGDPLIAFAYQFIAAGSSGGINYTDPTIDSITEINLKIDMDDGSINEGIGHINLNTINTNDQYICMLPFDDSGYADGANCIVTIHFTVSDCNFSFTAPDSMPTGWTFDNQSSQDKFTIHMTSGFNNDALQQSLIDAGWIPE